jgi:DNA-directed RNA polymerase specialized sigma24 family protein
VVSYDQFVLRASPAAPIGPTLPVVDLTDLQRLVGQLEQLSRQHESARVAAVATDLLERLRVVQETVSAARDRAVLELHGAGHTLHEIARSAGLTRGRVFQIVQRGRRGGAGA